jgi:hypothetical protein
MLNQAGLIMKESVFVFGSNLAGRHGKGAALHAKTHYGAKQGVGIGRVGLSYAIPTRGRSLEVLPISEIKEYVTDFIFYAKDNPETHFLVTRFGGLAGYKDKDIAPMFDGVPENCTMPTEWAGYYITGEAQCQMQDS